MSKEQMLDNDDVKVEILRYINDGYSQRQIALILGLGKTTVGQFLRKETYQDWWAANDKPIASGTLHDHRKKIKKAAGKAFILTSAQNNSWVHDNFLKSLQVCAAHREAQLLVGTFTYNKNGFQNGVKGAKDNQQWFDPKIAKHIIDEPVQLAEGLIWCGELNILPTAVNPLSGLSSYTKSGSGVVPHAKVQLESLPTHKSIKNCRMMYTTGAVTKQNYIAKKEGQKASFHHVFGALLVEVDASGTWHARHLIADSDSGEFYDLDTKYTPTGYTTGHRVEAMNWGDLHAEKEDPVCYEASFDADDSILNTLNPKYQFLHDTLDFTARNHHNVADPYFRFKMYTKGKELVSDNIRCVANLLARLDRKDSTLVMVESNHDLALQKWLKNADYKADPANALFFLDCQYASYKAIANDRNDFSVFQYALTNYSDGVHTNFISLKTDESFMICGDIECGMHGDLGVNGSRGSIGQFQKIGSRSNTGHTHSAQIRDGAYSAGVSGSLDMGYNRGLTTWSQSHIVTYPNGKRAIITVKDGKWRA